jgi:hypothetical protein
MSSRTYLLPSRNFKPIYIADVDGEFYVSLKEALKHCGLKEVDRIVKDLDVQVKREFIKVNGKSERRDFVDYKVFEEIFKLATSQRAGIFYQEIMDHKREKERSFDGITVAELVDPEVGARLLASRNDLAMKIMSLEAKMSEDKPYVDLIKDLAGNVPVVNLRNLGTALHFSKKLSIAKILEDLRGANIFDANNLPFQKFQDDGSFKVATFSVQVKGKSKSVQTVIVHQRGVRMVESLIIKKYGGIEK